MGRIMAVVNDLILRRDRDAQHRDSLSTTLRTVRAESLRQANDIQRLQERHADAQRKAALGEAAETALRAQLRGAEAGVHRLKEEAARTKALVAQTRAACATEVRKRDRQIDALKKAVADAGRARGAPKSSAVTTISVTGDFSAPAVRAAGPGRAGDATGAEGYDLRTETNAFLAELAKSLSEENETLLDLVRRTISRLTEMSGWDRMDEGQEADEAPGVGAPAQRGGVGGGLAHALPTNAEDMSAEMDAILEHLRTILTNPSFAPLEEVVVREEEINRLRDGWEKMETRWKEAVHLIDGWRRRMQTSGRSVNMEELKMGLRLSPIKVTEVEETVRGLGMRLSTLAEEQEEQAVGKTWQPEERDRQPSPLDSPRLVPDPEYEGQVQQSDADDADSSIFEDDVDVDELDVEEPNVQILQQSSMLDSPPLPVPPQLSPLRDCYSAGNRNPAAPFQRGPGDFTTILAENSQDLAGPAPRPPPHGSQPKDTFSEAVRHAQFPAELKVSSSSLDSILLTKPAEDAGPKRGRQLDTTGSMKGTPVRPSRSGARVKQQHSHCDDDDVSTRSETASTATAGSSVLHAASSSTASSSMVSSASGAAAPPTKSTDMPPPLAPPSSAHRSPRRANSRLPLPRTTNQALLPPSQQSPLTMATIAAKLAASERDADAARVRAKLRAARLGKKAAGQQQQQQQQQQQPPPPPPTATQRSRPASPAKAVAAGADSPRKRARREMNAAGDPDADELGADGPDAVGVTRPARKRERRTSRVACRRRSTLNPWEMEALITGGAAPAVPPMPCFEVGWEAGDTAK
ncbi:hypothetical protein P8C59_004759 [Phyllachora maydis]|uniref:NIMA interactive protein n=1 Tax=Phyllachora maydis TaxID=1825666 RepID=A0AAD9MBL6_9PEZI|nr:hypothetical protein P8C59_004759 [Phyllachora maydis]